MKRFETKRRMSKVRTISETNFSEFLNTTNNCL